MYGGLPNFNSTGFIRNHTVISEWENQLPTLVIHGLNDYCDAGTVRVLVNDIKRVGARAGLRLHAECLDAGSIKGRWENPLIDEIGWIP